MEVIHELPNDKRVCPHDGNPLSEIGEVTSEQLDIIPAKIQTLSDLSRIPFTTKQDLRDNYPFNMFAVPMDNVVRIHASSGPTGQPTVVGYTARDISTWSTLMARSLAAGGAGRGDIIHNAYGYGLFTGGLGVHYGAERLGDDVHRHVGEAEPSADREPDRHRRIEVTTGDVAYRVGHRQHGQPEGEGDPEQPDPDLLIRTGAEHRLSNFLLWQLAYTELYMTDALWPDFTRDDLVLAFRAYQQRERRFGKTGGQVRGESADRKA